MSEWWTYSLSDFLLFSPRTYYRLFELYNADLWPLQIALLAVGIAIPAALWHGGPWRGRFVGAVLAGCWIWVAWAFHWQRYSTINWAATYFAVAFAIEALLLIWAGVIRNAFEIGSELAVTQRIGLGVFVFALLVQPLLGLLMGREWAQVEVFGAAPDPTAVGTLGMLLAARRTSWIPLAIPLLWCATSGAILWTMDSPDALVLPFAGLAALFLATSGTAKGRRS